MLLGGGGLSRSWCIDLLLDVMNGIRTWDVEDDSKEWWLMNPESDISLATAVGT